MRSRTCPESRGSTLRAATPAVVGGRIVRVVQGLSEVGSGRLLGGVGMWTSCVQMRREGVTGTTLVE